MPWYPDGYRGVTVLRKPVTRFNAGGDKARLITRHRGHCLHIAVSEGASLFSYFNEPGNPCSHFYVRYTGIIEQYVDTDYVAPAQLEGNPTMIGTESQGGTSALETTGWTAAQLETIAKLNAWLHETHGIPLMRMPDSLPTSTGIGYHKLGVDPWRVEGGELWSSAYGKVCPGGARIAQVPGTIDRAKEILMTTTITVEDAELVVTRLLARVITVPGGQEKSVNSILGEASFANDGYSATQSVWALLNKLWALLQDGGATKELLDAILTAASRPYPVCPPIDVPALAQALADALPVAPDVKQACLAALEETLPRLRLTGGMTGGMTGTLSGGLA